MWRSISVGSRCANAAAAAQTPLNSISTSIAPSRGGRSRAPLGALHQLVERADELGVRGRGSPRARATVVDRVETARSSCWRADHLAEELEQRVIAIGLRRAARGRRHTPRACARRRSRRSGPPWRRSSETACPRRRRRLRRSRPTLTSSPRSRKRVVAASMRRWRLRAASARKWRSARLSSRSNCGLRGGGGGNQVGVDRFDVTAPQPEDRGSARRPRASRRRRQTPRDSRTLGRQSAPLDWRSRRPRAAGCSSGWRRARRGSRARASRPTCWAVLKRPEASPASSSPTPPVPSRVIGTNVRPIPMLIGSSP